PELRKDPVIGRWVIISSERGLRPLDYAKEPEQVSDKKCPFCAGNEKMTPPEILVYKNNDAKKDGPYWRVRVVPNKFPVLGIEGSVERMGYGIYDRMDGVGAHEVIVETPEHNKDMWELPDKNIEDIIWAFRDRINDLKRDTRFEYILVFKNKGSAAGASIYHPHSQLIALPMVPVRVRQEQSGAKQYFDYKERCVFCDIIRQELKDANRIISENDDFIAICPYASRFPFETWILPRRHDSKFEDIQNAENTSLAHIIKTVLKKMAQVLGNPSYNWLLHTSHLKAGYLEYYHWHIELMPKLTKVAGFEWGTGFYINPTAPEEAAKYLREA
ncbi:MAG: galactose-1-phosphate uridylyltransferase, partial [Elusimicrobiota bacterium]